jgi:hypothetical protein
MATWSGAARFSTRVLWAGWVIVLGVLLAACTGRGGGWLPPSAGFSGRATLGFSFSCEDSSGIVGPVGRLRIQLQYSDQGSNLLSGPFAIHGEADEIDPVVESAVCIGQNPPPGGSELIFLGTYRVTSSPPPGFPAGCATSASGVPPCRFEVIVRDNDRNNVPSTGDFFSIKLSSTTEVTSSFVGVPVFYTRTGLLGGGNLTVD